MTENNEGKTREESAVAESPILQEADIIIRLPRRVIESWSQALLSRLKKIQDKTEPVTLDATHVDWLSPFGTVVLADFALKRLQKGNVTQIRMPNHKETSEYIETSGLLNITQASNIADAIRTRSVQLRLLHEMDGSVPDHLSEFVCQQASNVGEDERYLLRTWITELLTNANDHAKSTNGFWVCGQYYPQRKDIRICVADSGIGIRKSLVDAGRLPPTITDADAIIKALEGGMTSRAGKTGGLGLKHISAYVKSSGGSMTIISGKGRGYLERKKKTRVNHEHEEWQGTIVNVRFSTKIISREPLNEPETGPFMFIE